MIRATLDVNVLVSGFPAERGTLADLIAHWTAFAFELVLSEHILTEAAEAWAELYWAARYTQERVQDTLHRLRAEATMGVPVTTVHGVGEDEEDDLVLATAIAGDVSFLVTGDRHLQALGQYQNVVILSPRQFLQVLADDAGDEP